jgi:deazaflavin-dependent oxidoreductase (nitroreductase family)
MAQVPGFVSFFNPLARRALKLGPLLGPNALITVEGRKTHQPRTTPVALVELNGRRWVVGTFGETNWVRNLRAAGQATLTVGRRQLNVTATELDVAGRAAFFRDQLGPYVRRLRIGGVVLSILKAREILDDPWSAAERRPVFELTPA